MAVDLAGAEADTGSGNIASAAFTASGTLIVATTGNSASGHTIEIWATGQSLAASS